MPNHLILIGAILWGIAIALMVLSYDTQHESSYAKGFQVIHYGKQWRV